MATLRRLKNFTVPGRQYATVILGCRYSVFPKVEVFSLGGTSTIYLQRNILGKCNITDDKGLCQTVFRFLSLYAAFYPNDVVTVGEGQVVIVSLVWRLALQAVVAALGK